MHPHLFVTCGSGLEPLLAEELAEMGFTDVRQGFRGVYVHNVDNDAIYRINYCSRIAGRVLLPLKTFRCNNKDGLYRAASEIDWTSYIRPSATIAIDANVTHPDLRNSLFAAQVVKDAICDQMRETRGSRPNVDVKEPDVQINLFIHDFKGVISIDTSGTPLHKRGYRQETGEAPLQESLAAALLRLAKYTGEEVLCDPCCGSGTLLIEAAMIATATPAGYFRTKWGFQQLPDYDHEAWHAMKAEIDSKRRELIGSMIFGVEINRAIAGAARRNLRAADFQDIEVYQDDFRSFDPLLPPQVLVTNPPHGNRLQDVDSLRGLYRSLGDFMKQKMAKPGRGFIFVGNLELTKEIGLQASRRHVINNSGVDSRLLEFEIY